MLRIALFVIGIVFGFYAVFQWLLPGVSSWQERREELRVAQEELLQLERKLANFQEISSTLSENPNRTETAYTHLPEYPNEERMLTMLRLAGESSGVFINDVSVGESEDTRQSGASSRGTSRNVEEGAASIQANELRMQYVDVTLGGVGSYESVKQFLRNIAGSERRIEVLSVSVARSSEEENVSEEGGVVGSDVLETSLALRFAYAKPAMAQAESILEDFAQRSSEEVMEFSREGVVFPEGGLGDPTYESGGRSNPFL